MMDQYPYDEQPVWFELESAEDKVFFGLEECQGQGWKAKLRGRLVITSEQIKYESHGIHTGDELEDAVCKNKSYPPVVKCVVQCSKRALEGGQQTLVALALKTGENEPDACKVSSFCCKTFFEEPTEAPVPGPSKIHVSFNVKAKDVIKSFEWGELRKDIENMLTKSRLDTLERGYNLIDSPCNVTIEAQLMHGDPASAATTLLKYFEKNHKGDDMLQFCEFLRNEAKEAGGSAALEGLADRIERAVKDLGASGEQTKWTLDDHCLFMCHSSKNKDIVDKFVQVLRGIGINVWYDKDEIRLGNEWDQKIATDMSNMYGFICCMSKDFFDSDICYRELQVFRDAQRRDKKIPDDSVFPIVIDPQSFGGIKQNWQMQLPPQTHYKKWPDDNWAILGNLETFVQRPVPSNPPPGEPTDTPPTSSTGVKKGRKRSPCSKRKEPSSDSEESDILQKPITECDDYEILLRNCVADCISSNLNALSTNLGVKLATRKAFVSRHPHDISNAAEEVLNHWAEGNTRNKAPTWLDLFAAMEKSKMAGEVKFLENELLKGVKKGRKHSPQHGSSSSKRKERSIDSEESVPPHEKDLCRLCWVPFGIQTLKVSPVGDDHTYQLQPNTGDCDEEDLIRLEVPKDAINTKVNKELSIRYGILVHGPFVIKKDYELASMVVYIDFNPDHTTKPFMLHLPHWDSEGEATNIVTAPHKVDRAEQYKFANKSLLPSTTGSIPIYGHCSLFAKAIKVKSQKFYYAHPLEVREDTETTLSVYFTYASTVWSEIIQCHVAKCKPPSKFKLGNKEKLKAVLEEDKGSDWEASFITNIEISEGIIRYNSNSEDDLKKDVCDLKSYPPVVECLVQCKRNLEGGRRKLVNLVFNKIRSGLEVESHNAFMSFACTTFSAEQIGAPVPGPSKEHDSSNPEEVSYSHVGAKDALQTFEWRKLRKDVKDMLTKSRVYTLERQYKLIDSPCKAAIKCDLEKGDPNSAVTTLIEYFEANHNGDDLLRFCEFLRDEAEEAGGSATLEGLADRIERAVKDLGASGSTRE